MHIAYLIPTIDRIGGAERQLIHLATGMAHRNYRVTVIALAGSGGHIAQDLSAGNVSFLSLEMRHGLFDPRGWTRLRRWIASAKPDVLHAHLPHAALMARTIRLLAPVRVVIDTIHSPATGSIARRYSYRLTSGLPDVVTAVSSAAARPWLAASAIRMPELSIIPNGIDLEHWKPSCARPEPRSVCSTSLTQFRWLAVGRLDPVKDHSTLLRAFSRLPAGVQLTIAGSGPLENALRLEAAELGIQDRVLFAGFQNDLRQLMQDSDAFVLSSRWEGHPIALMEACASGLPAVFTQTPGCRELLPGSSLPVAPVADPAALAVAMNALMALSESDRRQLAHEQRQRITALFDLRSVLDRYEVLYCQLLAANPRPSRHRSRAASLMKSLSDFKPTET